MASQIQLVMYEGFLGEDPVMRFTDTGKAVTNFKMASNRQYNTSDGKQVKEVTWMRVTAWNKMAEIANQYCEKGSHVIVTGRLKTWKNGSPEVYEGTDGVHRSTYEIVLDSLRILKGKESTAMEHEADAEFADPSEEVPF